VRPGLAGLALLTLGWSPAARAQQSAPPNLRYTAAQLDCVSFVEHSRSRLDAETGGRRRRETLTRSGVLRFRARGSGDSLALEAWYDSLALSRESPEVTLRPDTDGLIGGRFRGTLSPDGHYSEAVRPYIPDDVAEVADVGRTLQDLLPPLPPRPLAVGEQWTDGAGLELHRISDSSAGGRSVRRLLLRSKAQSDTAAIRGDTIQLPATEVTTEDGEVDWDAERGLVRRTRHIVIETTVPAGGPLKLPLRSRMEQQAELVRGARGCQAEDRESN
jgi:hypothetical protein